MTALTRRSLLGGELPLGVQLEAPVDVDLGLVAARLEVVRIAHVERENAAVRMILPEGVDALLNGDILGKVEASTAHERTTRSSQSTVWAKPTATHQRPMATVPSAAQFVSAS